MSDFDNAGATAIANAPKQKKAKAPCVGLPVQYTDRDGVTLPGVLQRKAITSDAWDVRVFPNGAINGAMRSAVQFSQAPKPGCWNFLPETV